ncbi:hypothetical protein B0H15DRAFT_1027419 [Mycena belliarum]|uniref:DUF7587 domain-containing protein n=1 Tax=Mycena belliarum TaxID=1033014 RepID=A0AAD6XEL2_9AGAR|nr:hypothetical protein B0H15DRAFT_1027419 [Mycena belliae]
MSTGPLFPDNLPQYGFGPETAFKNLARTNAFLFRVYTARAESELSFAAPKFDRRFASETCSPRPDPPRPTYADAFRHLDWTTRHTSPYVSASFSLLWAVWEALRRYHFNVKHDVAIAVIDAPALAAHSATVAELLNAAPIPERHENHWKWYSSANEAQSVLVYGAIPAHCILASVPLLRILDALPAYCLRPPSDSEPPQPAPVHRVSWRYPTLRPSYRRFCSTQLGASFARAAPEARFRASTAGAARLAASVLEGWTHRMLRRDGHRDAARAAVVAKVSALARAIALWPAAPETVDMWPRVVREIARLVAEDVSVHCRRAEEEGQASRYVCSDGSSSKLDLDMESEWEWEALDVRAEAPVPIVLDPRNYLPTPPPTPPPSFVLCPPVSAESERVGRDSGLSPLVPALSPQLLEDTCAEPSNGTPNANPVDESAIVPAADSPPSSGLSVHDEYAHSSSRAETTSCFLTGFLFGVVIVLVLSSQRRPALIYLS